jgi:hypothetical protein
VNKFETGTAGSEEANFISKKEKNRSPTSFFFTIWNINVSICRRYFGWAADQELREEDWVVAGGRWLGLGSEMEWVWLARPAC